ncbi:hypothetical protein [Polynucleobacter arcticus]|uniref:Outer membrane protein beta-barrel domain-containing protein n=1 Tax=Polynucleobacter arcticus TaxID=1743165 RepID=A0A6M9PMR4_9BURK|nr:hypothetical protein [Polynucleobacter arcticus]QKM60195.1 hypothetical protein DN92_03565 [Polynucleobacter arcticus]
MKHKFLKIFSATVISFFTSSAYAQSDNSPIPQVSDKWRFEVTPYLWSPGISSTLFFKDRYLDTAVLSSSNVLGDLKTGGMISAEAHYGNWGIMGDLVSATLQQNQTISTTLPTSQGAIPARLATKAILQQTILTGAATYTLINNQNAYVDGLVGVRSIGVTATLNLVLDGSSLSASDSKSTSTIDPIVGFKGRYRLASSSWYIPLYADIGGGGGTTNVTWQGMVGVGKTFDKWIDVSLAYRALYYDMSGSGLLQKTTMKGPQLAATFNF